MKKIILSILILALLTGCGIFDLGNFITPNDGEFLTTVKRLNTPEKIGNYMLENFTYEIHDFYAPSPYVLWQIQKGDCNDFATFGVFIADFHGYITYQIKIFDNTLFKHYVAVYDEDIWYSITNSRYYYFGFYDFKEIVDYVCYISFRDWTKYIVYDYWNNIVEETYKD